MLTCQFEDGHNILLRHIVVDALVLNENHQILLIKRGPGSFTRIGKYGLPAGYVDRDEDIKSAMLRELKEETGYAGEVAELFCINDNVTADTRKDDRQNISLVYVVKLKGGEKQLNNEVTEINWFSEDQLPGDEDFAFDHKQIIQAYFKHLRQPFALPLYAKDIL